jgi:hypothetical protein
MKLSQRRFSQAGLSVPANASARKNYQSMIIFFTEPKFKILLGPGVPVRVFPAKRR